MLKQLIPRALYLTDIVRALKECVLILKSGHLNALNFNIESALFSRSCSYLVRNKSCLQVLFIAMLYSQTVGLNDLAIPYNCTEV